MLAATSAATQGLTHRYHVRAWADHLQKSDQMCDVIVESEAPVLKGNVARIVPVRDIDIMLWQHRAYRGAQQRGEVA